jgi:adenylate cyclase
MDWIFDGIPGKMAQRPVCYRASQAFGKPQFEKMSAPRPISRRHRLQAAWICLAAVLLVIGLYFTPVVGTVLLRLERITRDAMLRHGKLVQPREDVVFLGIDESSLALDAVSPEEIAANPVLGKMKGKFPWSREVHAEAVKKLVDAGARVVILDLIFSAASGDPDGDAALAFAMDDYRDRVVIASMFASQNGKMSYLQPAAEILAADGPEDPRVGYASFWPDPVDDVIRETHARMTLSEANGEDARPGEPVYHSLAAAAIRQLGLAEKLPPGTGPLPMRFCRPRGFDHPGEDAIHPYRMHPIYEIFLPELWEANYQNGEFFKDKIVLIGPAASVFQDFKSTPFGQMLGPQLQLTALTCLLDKDGMVRPYNNWSLLGLAMIAACSAWVATALPRKSGWAVVFLGIALAGLFAGCSLSLRNGQLSPVTPTLLVAAIGGGGVLLRQFLDSMLERIRLQGMLSRMVSRNVAEAIIENKDSFYATLGGVRRPVTVLFSDVRGFTSMTEDSDPAALVSQLNEYLERMVDAVFAENGTLDKFIGDAVMAVWGNLGGRTAQEETRAAIRAALAMLAALDKLNDGWRARGVDPFAIGIGLHHGDAIVGNIGSDEKMEPTVIGDTVNLASRLEGLTKMYGCALLLSGETAALAGDTMPLRPLDRVRVKGKRLPVDLFTALDGKSLEAWPAQREPWSEILELFRAGDFSSAAEKLETFLARWPEDGPGLLLLERCRKFVANPPAEWDGIYTLESK